MRYVPAASILSATGPISGVIGTRRKKTTVIRKKYGQEGPSPRQLVLRAAFKAADLHWQYLSLANRQAWNAWRPWKWKMGYSAIMHYNITRAYQGLPLLDNPGMIP